MARPKKTAAKAAGAKKTTAKRTPKAATAKAKSRDPRVAGKGASSAKLLQSTSTNASLGTRRPPNNPDVPQATIDHLNTMLNDLKNILDDYAQHLRSLDRCRKAYGFSAWSLRYAQTPHINSWSFAKGKTPSYTA